MKLKQTILNLLNLLKLAFAISLLVSFVGCAGGGGVTPPTSDIASNSTDNGGGTINDDGSDEDDQPPPPVPMVFFIENRTNVSDDGNLELFGARGVTVSEIDGKHYLFVTGRADNGFSVFRIAQ